MSYRFSIAICFLCAIALTLCSNLQGQELVAAKAAWTDSDITQWARDHSPLAKLREAEAAATVASIDRDDRSQCAQANLMQRVLSDLACYERHEAAAAALKNAAQIRALEQQRDLINQSLTTFDELILLADKAERLELHEGNPLSLRRERLTVEDQLEQVEAGIAKSRILLAQQLGKPLAEAEVTALDGVTLPLVYATREDAYQAALDHRCDLRAIRQVCGSLNLDTLPAARQALAMLQPGMGLSVSSVARKALLASLHAPSPSNAELCRRREECQTLQAMREQQVQTELYAAWVEVQSNQHRLRIAQKRLEISQQLQRQSVEAIELDQGVPGSDLQALLEEQQAAVQLVERQNQLTTSIVELYGIIGAFPEQP